MYVSCKCLWPHSMPVLQMFPNAYRTTLKGADALHKLSKQGLVNVSDLSKRITAGRYASPTCKSTLEYGKAGTCNLVVSVFQNGFILTHLSLQISSVSLPLKRKWETLLWSSRQMDMSPSHPGLKYRYAHTLHPVALTYTCTGICKSCRMRHHLF